jgi:hypothetical protein
MCTTLAGELHDRSGNVQMGIAYALKEKKDKP